ncbi:MAG TPA: hypothetical protein H9884_10835 [Candidatus Yaniella excrementigallinarum]|nr:hypothetical protein [Candidatus Yaniella excrementigallinarum]
MTDLTSRCAAPHFQAVVAQLGVPYTPAVQRGLIDQPAPLSAAVNLDRDDINPTISRPIRTALLNATIWS